MMVLYLKSVLGKTKEFAVKMLHKMLPCYFYICITIIFATWGLSYSVSYSFHSTRLLNRCRTENVYSLQHQPREVVVIYNKSQARVVSAVYHLLDPCILLTTDQCKLYYCNPNMKGHFITELI